MAIRQFDEVRSLRISIDGDWYADDFHALIGSVQRLYDTLMLLTDTDFREIYLHRHFEKFTDFGKIPSEGKYYSVGHYRSLKNRLQTAAAAYLYEGYGQQVGVRMRASAIVRDRNYLPVHPPLRILPLKVIRLQYASAGEYTSKGASRAIDPIFQLINKLLDDRRSPSRRFEQDMQEALQTDEAILRLQMSYDRHQWRKNVEERRKEEHELSMVERSLSMKERKLNIIVKLAEVMRENGMDQPELAGSSVEMQKLLMAAVSELIEPMEAAIHDGRLRDVSTN